MWPLKPSILTNLHCLEFTLKILGYQYFLLICDIQHLNQKYRESRLYLTQSMIEVNLHEYIQYRKLI